MSAAEAKYIKFFFAALCLSLIILSGINVIIDPYRMYRLVERKGLNSYKPYLQHRVRLLKAYEVRATKPESVLLGTSRSHLGFRTSHPGWASQADSRYNLAFDGATTKEMYYYLLHAHAVKPVSQLLVGLETYHPSRAPGAVRPDFDKSLLLRGDSILPRWAQVASSDFRVLTSIDTIRDSFRTLLSQTQEQPNWYDPSGQRLGEVFFRRAGGLFVEQGPRAYFDEINRLEVGFKLEWRIPISKSVLRAHEQGEAADMLTSVDYIAKIIQFCREQDIEAIFFFTPAHVLQLELDALTGAWPAVEQGKRALVGLLDDDARRNGESKRFPLWDFSGYSNVTTEELPELGSRAEMQYYWDSSHFKQQVGDWVLDRIFNFNSADPAPSDFGAVLSSERVEELLENDRKAHQAYQAAHPQLIAEFKRLITEYALKHNIEISDFDSKL